MAIRPFDFHTTRVNKAGQRSQENPYTLHVIEGQQFLERPPGSGHFYNADGSPVDASDVPGKLQPKLRVPAKDQNVDDSVPQVVSSKEDGVVEVKEVEAPKTVLSSDKKSEDKRK